MKVADHSCTKFSVKVMYYCPKVVIELPEEEQMVVQEEEKLTAVQEGEKLTAVQEGEKAMVQKEEKAMMQKEGPLTEEQRFKVETSSPRFKTQYTEMR